MVNNPSQAITTYPPCICCGSTENERRQDKRMRSGWSSYCRKCANAKSLEWKKNNQERQLATTKAWRQANPDKVKKTRAKGVHKERAAALAWRHNNIERARENDKAWRKNNPDKARLKDAVRDTRMKNAIDEKITAEHIAEIREHQGNRCAYCLCDLESTGYHIDHFDPIARGGRHRKDNLVLACPTCNLQKGSKQPLEFMDEKPQTAIKNTEQREQARLIMWTHKKAVRDLMPQLKWLHHSANGEKRDIRTGNKLKAMGVKPGFPDLILPVKTSMSTGLVIEMKSAKGRLSTEQSEWLDLFIENNWQIVVCRSAEDARIALCGHLDIDPYDAPPLD